jgi:hypothetical protein
MNSDRYVRQILQPFFKQLTDNGKFLRDIQQHSANVHTAKHSIQTSNSVWWNGYNSWFMAALFSWHCSVWFLLLGYLKDKVCWTNPGSEEELKENIQLEVSYMSREQLQHASLENVSEWMGNIFGISCNTMCVS